MKGAIDHYNSMMSDVEVGVKECLHRSGNQIREAKRENRCETDQSSKHDDRSASYRISSS